ncbi:MAG: hypothetical protein ACYTGZ_03785 [Planctomycetota bacterium]|jgi:hypothetical protein
MTRNLAPWICAGLHVLALVVMALWLRPGTAWQPDAELRADYVAAHAGVWTAGWLVWMGAAVSLVGFYVWWAARLGWNLMTIWAVALGTLGCVCDLVGETIYLSADASFHVLATLLTAGAANGMYTLGGIVLTLLTPDLPRPVRLAVWTTWAAGALMTLSALVAWVPGIAVSTAVLFPLFIGWTVWMARSWRPA